MGWLDDRGDVNERDMESRFLRVFDAAAKTVFSHFSTPCGKLVQDTYSYSY